MEYKIAKKDDIEFIIKMKNEVKARVVKENLPIWKNDYPLDEMIIDDIVNQQGRVVIIDNKIVAYAVFHHASFEYDLNTFKDNNVQSFGRVMVCNDYLKKGVGKFLVKSMIEEAKTLNVNGMGILVDSCNIKALNLYKSFNFTKEGERQFPFAYLDIYTLYF